MRGARAIRIGLALLLAVAAPARGDPRPSPALAPADVVLIQLEALRDNGADDRGIATCFRFASPDNRAQTGPLPRFARMIREGPYRAMLEYLEAELHPLVSDGQTAVQRVTLVGADAVSVYVFVLSRQSTLECDGCWMTDGVYVETTSKRVS